MKRPLCVIGASFAIAILVAFYLLPKQALLVSALVIATSILAFVITRKQKLTIYVVALLSIGLGLAYGALYNLQKVTTFEDFYGNEVMYEGIILESKQGTGRGIRYTLQGKFANADLPKGKIVVRSYLGSDYRAGEVVSIKIKLNEPKYKNTRDYYKRAGISVEGYLLEDAKILPVVGTNKVYKFIIDLRERLVNNLYSALPNESADLLSAMVIGDTANLPPQLYSQLNKSGTSHLLSVSGLHLSLVLAFIGGILNYTRLKKQLQILLMFVGILAFTALVGFSAPILRAFVMSSIMLLANLSSKRNDPLSSLGLSAIIICFVWPYWVLSLGMWLSFLATAGIIVVGSPLAKKLIDKYKKKNKWHNRLIEVIVTSLAITIGAYLFTIPLLILETGWLSTLSPVSNLLVAPFTTISTIGGLVTAIIPYSKLLSPLYFTVDFSAKMIIRISQIIAKLPFSTFSFDYNYMLICLLLVAAFGIAAYKLRKEKKIILCFMSASILVFAVGNIGNSIYIKNTVQLVSLEDCSTTILIQGKTAVLVGAPDQYEASTIMGYLDFRGIKNIEALVVPDQKEQINSGLLRLRDNYSIRSIIGPDDSYILEQLSDIMNGIPIYSSSYAKVELLSHVTITFSTSNSDIFISVKDKQVFKTTENYDIMTKRDTGITNIYSDNVILGNNVSPHSALLGQRLFGELRVYL